MRAQLRSHIRRQKTFLQLGFELLASMKVGNYFLLFKSTSLWYFTIVHLANEYIQHGLSKNWTLISKSKYGFWELSVTFKVIRII